jgi:hypothetical protein
MYSELRRDGDELGFLPFDLIARDMIRQAILLVRHEYVCRIWESIQDNSTSESSASYWKPPWGGMSRQVTAVRKCRTGAH